MTEELSEERKAEFRKDVFLEHCMLPSKLSGVLFNSEGVQVPLVGITGLGKEFTGKNGKRNVWITGEILSAAFIGNDNCTCRSHIEGIVTESGGLHILESVYDFPAKEGDCIEYKMKAKVDAGHPIKFRGKAYSKFERFNFKPLKVNFELEPFWMQNGQGSGSSISYSLPYYNRHFTSGTYIPKYWEEFLSQIKKAGFSHPYAKFSKSEK